MKTSDMGTKKDCSQIYKKKRKVSDASVKRKKDATQNSLETVNLAALGHFFFFGSKVELTGRHCFPNGGGVFHAVGLER